MESEKYPFLIHFFITGFFILFHFGPSGLLVVFSVCYSFLLIILRQSGMRTYTTSATQTEEEKDQQQPGSEKFSWRSQVLPSSSIAKKAESMLKASVPSGSGM